MVTGIFPNGFMHTPLTALGLISNGVRLSKRCPRMPMIAWLAADMLAPESGNTVTDVVLEQVAIYTVIVGASSALSPVMLYNCM